MDRRGAAPETIAAQHSNIVWANRRARTSTASKIRRSFNKRYAWSPIWLLYQRKVILWSAAVKRTTIQPSGKFGYVNGDWFDRLARQCGIKNARVSKFEAETKLKEAKAEFKDNCKRADELRDLFIKELAAARAAFNDTTIESELKQLKQIIKQCK